MKSSDGEHFVALDHVRALAVFLVVVWHFTHGFHGSPVPFEYSPTLFLLAPFEEGHTGVALFMVLSGYLFARLLNGRAVAWPQFFWNRALRLLPLLALVVVVIAAQRYWAGQPLSAYWREVAWGWLKPSLPQGGWSITVELHFYLLLPGLLWFSRGRPWVLGLCVVLALILRGYLHHRDGTVQWWSYLTLVGRIDQFVLGMLAFHCRGVFARRHGLAAGLALAFCGFYSWFSFQGGYFSLAGFPSTSAIWVVLPLFEALFFAALLAWYDASFKPVNTGLSAWIAKIGDYSYAIYLLHFFFVFAAAQWVHAHVIDLSNFYLAFAASAVFLLAMMPVAHLARICVEAPALRFRKSYLRVDAAKSTAAPV
jgi:peptidoglycan/LPS O-acetylase OafA/YrhL